MLLIDRSSMRGQFELVENAAEEFVNVLLPADKEEGPTPLWILAFTDGMDRPMNVSNMNASLKSVTKRAEEEDVMIYAIGLEPAGASRGGTAPTGGSGGRGGGFGRGGFGGGGFGGGRCYSGGGYGQADHPDDGLPKIAATTGGGYFELTASNDLASTFQKVADELHHQYALGFTPANLDGKMHALEVRLAGAGLTARARKSYLARAVR